MKAAIYFYPKLTANLGHVELDIYGVNSPLQRVHDRYIKIEMPEIDVEDIHLFACLAFFKEEDRIDQEEAKASLIGIPKKYNPVVNNCCHKVERRLFLLGYFESMPKTSIQIGSRSFQNIYNAINEELVKMGKHVWAITPHEFTRQMSELGLRQIFKIREQILADQEEWKRNPVTQVKKLLNNDIQRLKLDRYQFQKGGFAYYDEKEQATYDSEIRKLDDLLQVNEVNVFIEILTNYSEGVELAFRPYTIEQLRKYRKDCLTPNGIAISEGIELSQKRIELLQDGFKWDQSPVEQVKKLLVLDFQILKIKPSSENKDFEVDGLKFQALSQIENLSLKNQLRLSAEDKESKLCENTKNKLEFYTQLLDLGDERDAILKSQMDWIEDPIAQVKKLLRNNIARFKLRDPSFYSKEMLLLTKLLEVVMVDEMARAPRVTQDSHHDLLLSQVIFFKNMIEKFSDDNSQVFGASTRRNLMNYAEALFRANGLIEQAKELKLDIRSMIQDPKIYMIGQIQIYSQELEQNPSYKTEDENGPLHLNHQFLNELQKTEAPADENALPVEVAREDLALNPALIALRTKLYSSSNIEMHEVTQMKMRHLISLWTQRDTFIYFILIEFKRIPIILSDNVELKEIENDDLINSIRKNMHIPDPRIFFPFVQNNCAIELHFSSENDRNHAFQWFTFPVNFCKKLIETKDKRQKPQQGHDFRPFILILRMPNKFANEMTPDFYFKVLIEILGCKKQLLLECQDPKISVVEKQIKLNKIKELEQLLRRLTSLGQEDSFRTILSNAKENPVLVLKRYFKSRVDEMLQNFSDEFKRIKLHGSNPDIMTNKV